MDIAAPLVPNPQAAETMQPTERAFDYPAPFPEAFVRFDATPGNSYRDATLAQPYAMASVVVAFVVVHVGSIASWSLDDGDLLHIVNVPTANQSRHRLRRSV